MTWRWSTRSSRRGPQSPSSRPPPGACPGAGPGDGAFRVPGVRARIIRTPRDQTLPHRRGVVCSARHRRDFDRGDPRTRGAPWPAGAAGLGGQRAPGDHQRTGEASFRSSSGFARRGAGGRRSAGVPGRGASGAPGVSPRGSGKHHRGRWGLGWSARQRARFDPGGRRRPIHRAARSIGGSAPCGLLACATAGAPRAGARARGGPPEAGGAQARCDGAGRTCGEGRRGVVSSDRGCQGSDPAARFRIDVRIRLSGRSRAGSAGPQSAPYRCHRRQGAHLRP